jgi:A-kinase anchor protein 10
MDSRKAVHFVEFWLTVESFASHGRGCYATTPPVRHSYHTQLKSTGKEISSQMEHQQSTKLISTALSKESSSPSTEPSNPQTKSSNLTVEPCNQQTESSYLTVESSKTVTVSSSLANEYGSSTAKYSYASSESSKLEQECDDLEIESFDSRNQDSQTKSTSTSAEAAILDDAIEIYTTFVALNALKPVELSDAIRQEIEVHLCPEEDGGGVSRNCFKKAQVAVLSTMEQRFYPGFLASPALAQYQLQALSCAKVELIDVLNCPNTAVIFREYLEQEGHVHFLDFWYIADHFTAALMAQSGCHISVDGNLEFAMLIYDKYISLQASEPLGLGDEARQEVEQRICDLSGTRGDSFQDAQQRVLKMLESDYFVRFKQSHLFLAYHSKLLHSVNESESVFDGRRPSSVVTERESKDVLDLDDPDELWRKPKLSFRFGYVDKMGTFVSEANLESFLQTKEGKILSEKKFFKQVGRLPSYSKSTMFLIPIAEEIIFMAKSDVIEYGDEVGMETALHSH